MTPEQELELLELERERRRRVRARGQGNAPVQDLVSAIPGSPSAAPEPDNKAPGSNLNFLGKALQGVSQSIGETAYGLKEAVAGLRPEEQRMIQERRALDTGAVGTGAKVAGDIATWAAPGAKAVEAVNAVAKLPRLLKLALGGAAASAPQGFVEPVADESLTQGETMAAKGANAAKAATVGSVLNTSLAGLGKVASQTFKPSNEAQYLLERGVVPKLQEGAESKTGQWIGRLTKGAVDSENKREIGEVVQVIARRIAPKEDLSGFTVPQTINRLKEVIDDEYEQILSGKRFTMTGTDRTSILNAGRKSTGGRRDARNIFEKEMDSIFGPGSNNRVFGYDPQNPNAGLSRMREKFQERIERLRRGDVADKDAADALSAAKERFDTLVRDTKLSPDELTRLRANDEKWKSFVPLRTAANSAEGARDFNLSSIINASKRGTNVSRADYSNADVLDPANRMFGAGGEEGRRLMVALNRALGPLGHGAVAIGGGATLATHSPLAAAILGPAYAASLAGQTRGGARALYGDFEKQKQLAEWIRKTQPERFSGPLGGLAVEED